MKHLVKIVTLLSAALLSGMASVQGSVLIRHSGSIDPATEGWTLQQGNNPRISAHAATDGGTAVWQINNVKNTPEETGSTHYLYYQSFLPQDLDLSTGWSLTVSLRVDGVSQATGAQSTITFLSEYDLSGQRLSGNDRISYTMYFGTASGGGIRFQVLTSDGAVTVATGSTATAGDYHTFSLEWNPGDTAVSALFDGEVVKSDFAGVTASTVIRSNLQWGNAATSSSLDRTTYWKQVEFAVVPEPSTLGFLGIFGGFMAACATLSRRGQQGTNR
ncbi:MAG TPA: hypothetical protein VNQ90_01020 [Chthoniobacteraceae bacterium]|nr:hypothetical protein [Chthoniobacteraceae bacterium]